MPNYCPEYLRMYRKKRITRRQGEAIIKALLTVDEDELFDHLEKQSFSIGFDKLTEAWRAALKKEAQKSVVERGSSAQKSATCKDFLTVQKGEEHE